MTRVRILLTGKILTMSVVALLSALPAQADLITVSFEGEVDFTSEGGEVYAYSGSFTWNTAASSIESEPGLESYPLASYSLIFDGVDVTIPVSPDGNGNAVTVVNDLDVFGTGALDGLGLLATVGRPFDPTGDLSLIGILAGPTTMFSSTALPGSLDFLGDVSSTFTAWLFEPDGGDDFLLDTTGTLRITGTDVTPVPEPSTLVLTAFGLAGLCARARRARRSSTVS